MSFQWLTMRIGEEKDRRVREAQILGMMPAAVEEMNRHLSTCVGAYNDAFGAGAADIRRSDGGLHVSLDGASVDVLTDIELPGFRVKRDTWTMDVQVGVLPGDRLYYFDVAADQYMSIEELTRRILDRVLFPKLREL
jgi:hypothetical protein